MELSDVLNERLRQRELTKYALAKILAEMDGSGKAPNQYTSRLAKVFDDPKGRIFANLEEVIKALGGRVVIEWTDTTSQPIH
jgi:hypothetical protein